MNSLLCTRVMSGDLVMVEWGVNNESPSAMMVNSNLLFILLSC